MSLLPLIIDLAEELSDRPYHRPHNFGLSIHPNDLEVLSLPYSLLAPSTGYHQRPRCLRRGQGAVEKNIPTTGKDGFQVCLDVKDFAPNEISVKTVDNSIVIEGKHEERQDEHGYISRHFTRRYALPQGYEAKDVISQLSSDGVLTVKAPPIPKAVEGNNVRVVQIQQTGPAHLSVGNKEGTDGKAVDEKKKKSDSK